MVKIKIQIGGDEWTIELGRRMKAFHGRCSVETKTIQIAAGLSEEDFRDTLFHEILHAALWYIDVAELAWQKDRDDVWHHYKAEPLVAAMAVLLTEALALCEDVCFFTE